MRDKTILVIITILFLVTGSLLLFSTLNEYSFGGDDVCIFDDIKYMKGDEINNYLYDSKCVCGSGGLIDCIPKLEKENVSSVILDTSELETAGLDFSYSYVMGVVQDDLSLVPKVDFQSISIKEGKLNVVLEQLQACPQSNVVAEQVGFYKRDERYLKLYNMIRTVENDLALDCVVELRYVFDDFEGLDFNDTEIRFVDESGLSTSPKICFYNERVYSDGDVFQQKGGGVCACNGGEIDCD